VIPQQKRWQNLKSLGSAQKS